MSIEKILADIPESEKTPLVLLLIEIIKKQAQEIIELKEEIARLKGNPVRPKLKHSKTSKINKEALYVKKDVAFFLLFLELLFLHVSIVLVLYSIFLDVYYKQLNKFHSS